MLTTAEAVFEAISNDDWESVKESLWNRTIPPVELNEQDEDGKTILMLAVENDQQECVILLIQSEVSLDLRDVSGYLAIDYAARLSSPICFNELVAAIDSQANDGSFILQSNPQNQENLLMQATESKEILQTVIDRAKAHIEQEENKLDIQVFSRSRINQRLNAFINHRSTSGKTALHIFMQRNASIDCINILLDHGVEKNAKDIDSNTALMAAVVKFNRDEVIKLLLIKGVDLDCQNKKLDTAIMLAARYGNFAYVNILLKAKANLLLKNESGFTFKKEIDGKKLSEDQKKYLINAINRQEVEYCRRLLNVKSCANEEEKQQNIKEVLKVVKAAEQENRPDVAWVLGNSFVEEINRPDTDISLGMLYEIFNRIQPSSPHYRKAQLVMAHLTFPMEEHSSLDIDSCDWAKTRLTLALKAGPSSWDFAREVANNAYATLAEQDGIPRKIIHQGDIAELYCMHAEAQKERNIMNEKMEVMQKTMESMQKTMVGMQGNINTLQAENGQLKERLTASLLLNRSLEEKFSVLDSRTRKHVRDDSDEDDNSYHPEKRQKCDRPSTPTMF